MGYCFVNIFSIVLLFCFLGTNSSLSADTSGLPHDGRQLYVEYCVACHGLDGHGVQGVPDLTDGVWKYGDQSRSIRQSIANGRNGLMPGFGLALGKEGVEEMLGYVLYLSGRRGLDARDLAVGQNRFVTFCSTCHGADGKGAPSLGAPNLTDDRWIHGVRETDIRDVIDFGRSSEMPAYKQVLSADDLGALTRYVRSLNEDKNPE
jgi:cytochrome c oxidase cbb3-type subunit 3